MQSIANAMQRHRRQLNVEGIAKDALFSKLFGNAEVSASAGPRADTSCLHISPEMVGLAAKRFPWCIDGADLKSTCIYQRICCLGNCFIAPRS
jgi:hypothetical protein